MRNQEANQNVQNLTVTFPSADHLKHFEKLSLTFAHTPWEEFLEMEVSLYRMALMAIIGESHELSSGKESMVAIAYAALTHSEIINDLYRMSDQEEE